MKKLLRYILSSWKAFLVLVLVVPLLAYTVVNWLENKYSPLPYKGYNDTWVSKKNAIALMPFSFSDQQHQVYGSGAIKGKITVANFFFSSCPTICPDMFRHIKKVSTAYANTDDVRFISFTVDPERDTPEKLAVYGKLNGIDPCQWKLLTGDKKELYRLARKGFYITATEGDGGPEDFIHSDRLVLMDKDQFIRGYYDGTSDKDIQLLINDIKKLEND
ncbi:SCO family protein [Pinibacter soli]|uniref:SCO family protein n=1 Tax=Pinibacter soli TaxID=3044211 RepID=A0ABT6REI8_9BACT|nr:SCO family protein [Pinibacter soli]MDI3320826.1 SCO family protein [Pinibacter soli]